MDRCCCLAGHGSEKDCADEWVDDRTELNDYSGGERERVAMMSLMYEAWAARCEVRDWLLD